MKKGTLLTLGSLALTLTVVALITFSVSEKREREGTEAYRALSTPETESTYTDLAGNPVDLTGYTGSIVVVNAWASWCPFCAQELADLAVVANEFSDQEVAILAINRTESKEQVERFMRTLPNTEGVTFALDPTDHFYQSIDGFAMPETVIYGPNGNIVFRKRGVMTVDEMRQEINTAVSARNTR